MCTSFSLGGWVNNRVLYFFAFYSPETMCTWTFDRARAEPGGRTPTALPRAASAHGHAPRHRTVSSCGRLNHSKRRYKYRRWTHRWYRDRRWPLAGAWRARVRARARCFCPPSAQLITVCAPPPLPSRVPLIALPCFCGGFCACLSGRFYQLMCRGRLCRCILGSTLAGGGLLFAFLSPFLLLYPGRRLC